MGDEPQPRRASMDSDRGTLGTIGTNVMRSASSRDGLRGRFAPGSPGVAAASAFTSAAAAFGSCVLHTWYADMTMPLCAQPPRKGVEVLTASVSRSPVLTVPLIASTTVLPALSTHT